MEKYDKYKFLSKKRKRLIEKRIVDLCLSYNISRKSYVGLVGRTLKTHYNNWSRLLGKHKYGNFKVVERNDSIYRALINELRWFRLKDLKSTAHSISIVKDDIFNYLYQCNLKDFSVIDIDGCCTLDSVYESFLEWFVYAIYQDQFRGKFCINLTYTLRKQPNHLSRLMDFLSIMVDVMDTYNKEHKHKYKLLYHNHQGYRDKNSPPMCEVTLIIYRS
jgi:hypothetical protein